MQWLPEGLRRLKEQVRELYVQSAELRELSEWIGEFGRLETLDLRGDDEQPHREGRENGEMTNLPESIGNLECLKAQHLSGFAQLEALPESIGRLTALESLNLGACGLTELPVGLRQLTSLRTLHITDLNQLSMLPSTLWVLTGLQELTIDNCESFEELPPSIGQLMSLCTLRVSGLPLQTLPSTFGALAGLRKLRIRFCSSSRKCRSASSS